MKISKIMFLAVATLGLSSCMNEELEQVETRMGTMALSVDKVNPKPVNTRAVDTNNFPVSIYTAEGKLYQSFATVADVPAKYKMPVGQYYVEAHTPGELSRFMYAPYYSGTENFEILQAVNTDATVICRMANGAITVKFGHDEASFADFKELFKDWSVTITDSKETPLIFTKEQHDYEPPTTYIKFAEGTDVLTLNFSGITKYDANVKSSFNLTKANASDKYDNDETYFSGGDLITITLTPDEASEGYINFDVKANIEFEESEENSELDVEDNPESWPEWEDPNTPEETGPITLKLPNHMVIDSQTDPALGNTNISAENGIKSIMVKISSDSETMIASLQQMVDGYPAATFIDGAELVGNQDIVRLFGDLGQTLNVPAQGDTEYVFPIGNFFTLLAVMEGVHTFDMIVTDMEDNVKKGKLVLAVGRELPEIEDEPATDEPGNAGNITLNLPKDMTINATTDPTLGNTLIECPEGIQKIIVKINGTEAMMGSLAALAGNYNGVDFVEGTDIVGNTELVRLFSDLGQTLEAPTVGQTSYTFPIGNFFVLLSVMPGDHTFNMEVTDMAGNTKSGKLVLTVE